MTRSFHIELQSRLTVESCPRSDEYARIPHVLLGLNNEWAKPYYTPMTVRYVLRNPGFQSKEATGAIQDDYHISQDDSETPTEIEKPIVYQFMKRKTLDDASLSSFELAPLHSLVESRNEKSLGITVPPPLSLVDCRFLKVKIENVLVESAKSNDCGGLLYLYDSASKSRVSESVYFSRTDLGFRFVQTGHDSVVFEVRKPLEDLYLVCVLVHKDAYLFTSPEGTPKKGNMPANIGSCPVVLAASSFKLSNTKLGNNKFDEPWMKMTDTESFAIPCAPAQENVAAPGIRVTFFAEVIDSEDLGEHCYATDSDRVDKLLRAVSIPQVLGHPRVAVHVHGMQIMFSTPQKADFFSIHAYLCAKPVQDLMKPVGSGGFAPNLASESLTSYGKTWPLHASKKMVFPDCFKISLLEEITKTTHLLFHIMGWDKKGQSISYIAILPLFTEKGPIQSGEYDVGAFSPGSLKGSDYLSKLKPPGKTVLSVSVELPAIFCVPKAVTDFAEARERQLDLFQELLKLPIDILQKHYVPIAHRLLLMTTAPSLECFCKLTQKCWNGQIPMVIRSALFYSWDFNELQESFFLPFTCARCKMIKTAINAGQVCYPVCIGFLDELMVLRYACHTNGKEREEAVGFWFETSSLLIQLAIRNGETESAYTLTRTFNTNMFFFRSLSNTETERMMALHLRKLLAMEGDKKVLALSCIFRGMLIFAQSSSFMLQIVRQLPVAPLNTVMFSAFHPFLSIMFRAFDEALSLNNEGLTKDACDFLCQLCLPLEAEDVQIRYICAYALFPLFDLIFLFWDSSIGEASRKSVIPIIMFLIGYTPAQLLQNYFATLYGNFRLQLCVFLTKAAQYVIDSLEPTSQSYLNHQFADFSQRIIRALLAFFPCGDEESYTAMIPLVSKLVNQYQTPRNYPRLFDITVKLTKVLPRNRSLMNIAIRCITFNLQIVRCFALSSLLCYFETDFETSGNLLISRTHFFDVFISALLKSPEDQLVRYRTLLLEVQNCAAPLVNEAFAVKLSECLHQVTMTVDVVEKVRSAKHSIPFRCIDSMRMADQYKDFPSHRIKWLENIVRLNKRMGWYASAFVAQMHVCTVIETVISHYHSSRVESERPINLVVTQPMSGSLSLLDQEILFLPFLTAEANIDFNTLADDFKIVAGEFTQKFLVKHLEKAGTLAMKANLYYEARCVYSMLLRIAKCNREWECIRKYSDKSCRAFGSMTANSSFYPDTPLVFYYDDNRIFCYDRGTQVPESATEVYRLEKQTDGKEYPHCFNVFRSRPSDDQLLVCGNGEKEITLHQYTTKDYLPRFTVFSDIAEVRTVEISLMTYVKMEASRLRDLMELISDEFEKCFPVPHNNLKDVTGNFRIRIEAASERLVATLKSVFEGKASLFALLKKVASDEKQRDEATQLAEGLRGALGRLVMVYRTCVECLKKPKTFLETVYGLLAAFTSDFGLRKIDEGIYQGNSDPLLSGVDYDVF